MAEETEANYRALRDEFVGEIDKILNGESVDRAALLRQLQRLITAERTHAFDSGVSMGLGVVCSCQPTI